MTDEVLLVVVVMTAGSVSSTSLPLGKVAGCELPVGAMEFVVVLVLDVLAVGLVVEVAGGVVGRVVVGGVVGGLVVGGGVVGGRAGGGLAGGGFDGGGLLGGGVVGGGVVGVASV